jgi:hypothetical protein
MEQLERLLNKYGFERRPQPLEQDIIDTIPFQLPDDYRFYLENYESFEGFIASNYMHLWPGDNLLEINNDYEFPEYRPDILGIGTDGGGNFIGIKFNSDSTHRIILSDFLNDEEKYFYDLGASFLDMLTQLDNGRDWFE